MEEIWKDIEGYEGRYQVSNLGNVKSLNYGNHGYEKNLTPKKNNKGYLSYQLTTERVSEYKQAHRLVANAFIDNPQKFPFVNHKDENPLNNCVDNLEWCTHLYNVEYSLKLHPERRKREKIKSSRKYRRHMRHLIKMDLNGKLIQEFENVYSYCKDNKLSCWSIIQCCYGNRKTAYGCKWKFAD